jgi:hypothetical protein
VNDQDAWITRNAALARRALTDPQVRAELLALLGVEDADRRRKRRREAARRELETLELRWRLEDEDADP